MPNGAGPETLAATEAAAGRGELSRGLRLALREQSAIMRSMLAARSAPRRGW
jgi:hypothetical protein